MKTINTLDSDQVREQVGNQVGFRDCNHIWDNASTETRSQVSKRTSNPIWDCICDQAWGQVTAQLNHQLED